MRLKLTRWMGLTTLASALVGCQTLPSVQVDTTPKTLAQGQVWLAQGHYHQATTALHQSAHRMPDDSDVWLSLGRAYWAAGIEAVATSAALSPRQPEIERLADLVFELEEFLRATSNGYRADRDVDFTAGHAADTERNVGRIQVVDPVWRPQ